MAVLKEMTSGGLDGIQEVGYRRTRPLNLERIDALNGRDQTLGLVATVAGIEQPRECPLVDLSNL